MSAFLNRRTILSLLAGCMTAPVLAQRRRRELEVPYVPTPEGLVEKMLDLAAVGDTDYLIDLGCGDGRIAIEAGRRGARALGVDLDDMRLQQADVGARRAGVQGRVSFRRQDLFATPIFEASVIALYLLPAINLRLRPRLLTELQAGARVVSHAFDMGDWQPDVSDELDSRRVFLWHVPAVAGGSWEVTGSDSSYRLLELEQRFQMVNGTLSGGGATVPVSGRLRGETLTMASADGTLRFDGRVAGDAIEAADGSWRAVRSG